MTKKSSRELMFKKSDVIECAANDAIVGTPITRRSKYVATDYDTAAKAMTEASRMFEMELNKLNEAQDRLSAAAKATSSNVRKAANEIHEGLQRIEKAANFDRLERQVSILERAAAALKTLAELEQGGKLARVIEAVTATT